MNDRVPYSYKPNEEIARWCVEIFFKTTEDEFGWWIAFTNPTAGPWKKIVTKTADSKMAEIYRFGQTDDRPDLIVVNDKLKKILVIEAKDDFRKLLEGSQMKKSIQVISDISAILNRVTHPEWAQRRSYQVVPSFLWFSINESAALEEEVAVTDVYKKFAESNFVAPLNIAIYKSGEKLIPNFIYKHRSSDKPVF